MEEIKKRKMEETGNGQVQFNSSLPSSFSSELSSSSSSSSMDELRFLLDPLSKPQLVDLLAKLGFQYPHIAEAIRSVASADPALRKLFVRGLAWNTTSETLCAAFEVHGEIEEGAVITDKVTGKSRGYGFITYKNMESAQKALKAPSKMIDGRMAACNLASEGLNGNTTTPDQAQRKLYIGGLSPETTSELLLSFFERHGEIEEGSVAYDKDSNKSRGFGFVTYKTVEAAKKALDDPQKTLAGRNVTVKLADNHKSKVMQTPVVPVPMAMAATYPHGHNSYNYPPQMPTYPGAPYSSPPIGGAAYPPAQPQPTYPQYVALKKDPPPYYMPKQ